MNVSRFQFSAPGDNIDYDEMVSFCSEAGSTIAARFDFKGQLDVAFRCSKGELRISQWTGDWDYAQDAYVAREAGDVKRVYELMGAIEGKYEVEFRNDPSCSGLHWIGSEQALTAGNQRGWFTSVNELSAFIPLSRLVVNDLGERVVLLKGMVVHGPDVWPSAPTIIGDEHWESAERYRQLFHSGSRLNLPQPSMFEPVGLDAAEPQNLRRLFGGLCVAVAWLWLAKKTTTEDSKLALEFEGVRSTLVTLNALPDSAGFPEVMELWTWASSSIDVLRHEATQQAASFSVGTGKDLETASPHILRTAKYLARLATQGAVAEALATRRTAREAASAAARSTSEFVQQTARTFLDRLVAVLVGWVAVYISYQEALVKTPIVSILLWAILCVLVLTYLSALVIDYGMARAMLVAVKKDLDTFRDILTGDDIDSIKNSGTLTTAERKLRHAAIGLTLVFLLALVAWTIGRFYLVGCPDWSWLARTSLCTQS